MKANTKVYTPMMNGRCWLEKGQLQHNVTYLFHEINHKIKRETKLYPDISFL